VKIRKAIISDKKEVLKFCKNTFSWGDYISEVWNIWISRGILLVILENDKPIAISHAIILPLIKQVWIEGIRVNEKYRRKGCAQKLIKKSEDFAKKQNCTKSQMLIESKNCRSLSLAAKLNYKKNQRWNYYCTNPKKNSSKTTVQILNTNKIPRNFFSGSKFYVDSWRWIPFDKKSITHLVKKKRIIVSQSNKSINAIAVYTISEYFDKTLMLTILESTQRGIKQIITYIQNYAFVSGFERIQILTRANQSLKDNRLEKKISFYLMTKNI